MKNKRNNGSPKGLSARIITSNLFKKHARVLTQVLFVLRKTRKDLTSDHLWSAMKNRWSRDSLERAITTFQGKQSVSTFERLLRAEKKPIPQAGQDGFISLNGEKYGTRRQLASSLRISSSALKRLITRSVRRIRGRTWKNGRGGGVIKTFYALSDVKNILAMLLPKKAIRAGADGFAEFNREKWATIKVLADHLGISQGHVRRSVKKGVRRRTGKPRNGLLKTPFYSLTDLKKKCKSFLDIKERADKTGFIVAEDERWGTVEVLAKYLGLSMGTVRRRLNADVRCRRGKTAKKRPLTYYALNDVKKACGPFLDVPRVNKRGLFFADGETWGTCLSLSKLLGVSDTTVRRLIAACTASAVRRREGIDQRGNRTPFFALSDLQKFSASSRRVSSSKKEKPH